MEAIHEAIQQDIVWLTWAAFFIAIPLYRYIRQRDPSVRWHAHGNVGTQAFERWDLALVVIFFFGLKVLLPALLPLVMGRSPMPAGDASPIELTTGLLFGDACIKIMLMSFLVAFLFFRGLPLAEVFGLNRLNLKGIAIWGGVVGVLVIPLVMAVGLVATQVLSRYIGELPPQPIVEAFLKNQDWVFRVTAVVLVIVITPVFEETLYRGYFYGVCKRFSDRFFAAIFSSLVFATAHPGVISLIPIFVLAIFLVLAYELSGSLVVPIVIHTLFNTANLIGMFFVEP